MRWPTRSSRCRASAPRIRNVASAEINPFIALPDGGVAVDALILTETDMIDREKLKADDHRGARLLAPFHDGLLELCPEFLAAYLDFQDGPAREGHLEPKVREFIYIAIDGAVSHLYESGLRRHIEDALRLGATKEEVLQVIMLATAAQGQHPNARSATRSCMEELGERRARAERRRSRRRKDASYARRPAAGREAGDAMLASRRSSPRASSATARSPWTAGPLPAKIKAFVGLAVCASPALLL